MSLDYYLQNPPRKHLTLNKVDAQEFLAYGGTDSKSHGEQSLRNNVALSITGFTNIQTGPTEGAAALSMSQVMNLGMKECESCVKMLGSSRAGIQIQVA